MNKCLNNVLKKWSCPHHKSLSLKQRHAVSIFNPGDRMLSNCPSPFLSAKRPAAQSRPHTLALRREAAVHGH